jgi:hypothetical protein
MFEPKNLAATLKEKDVFSKKNLFAAASFLVCVFVIGLSLTLLAYMQTANKLQSQIENGYDITGVFNYDNSGHYYPDNLRPCNVNCYSFNPKDDGITYAWIQVDFNKSTNIGTAKKTDNPQVYELRDKQGNFKGFVNYVPGFDGERDVVYILNGDGSMLECVRASDLPHIDPDEHLPSSNDEGNNLSDV